MTHRIRTCDQHGSVVVSEQGGRPIGQDAAAFRFDKVLVPTVVARVYTRVVVRTARFLLFRTCRIYHTWHGQREWERTMQHIG